MNKIKALLATVGIVGIIIIVILVLNHFANLYEYESAVTEKDGKKYVSVRSWELPLKDSLSEQVEVGDKVIVTVNSFGTDEFVSENTTDDEIISIKIVR